MSPADERMSPEHILVEDDRTGTSPETLRRAILDNLFYIQGKFPGVATPNDYYMALAYTVRDRLLHRWIKTVETWLQKDVKVVCYLSAEFLLGPHLGNNLLNLGIEEPVRQAVEAVGQNLDELIKQEEEPGLGNGGLGRLAACYMDSLATLEVPAIGFGIRYEHGIFHQEIRDGWQVETTDNWLHLGNPWEIARPEVRFEVKLGGHTLWVRDAEGRLRVRWVPDRVVKGTPFDTPISGYRVNTCNTLRLWKAEAAESFDFQAFNIGDTTVRSMKRWPPKTSPRFSIQTTSRLPVNSCVWNSNTFSSPARCKISSGFTCNRGVDWRTCTPCGPSSSTTPIRP